MAGKWNEWGDINEQADEAAQAAREEMMDDRDLYLDEHEF